MKPFTKMAVIAAASLAFATTAAAACGGQSTPQGMHGTADNKMHIARKVVNAVSQTGLSAAQTQAVTDAINTFKAKQMTRKAAKTFPIDAFGEKAFDAKQFKAAQQKQFDAKIDAMTELFTTIYAVLTPEQRPVFKRAFTAPMVKMMIKRNMIKGGMKSGGGMQKSGMKGAGMKNSNMKCGGMKCGGMSH
ncbi:Spy/CpxP family protein refolding chaperone [Sulfurimonas diazotrophicus]|uniref:Spy/CpxP family protein refolding chaperone n=1 Tax=Sulfurimonas diazotrophicus TaxID=3131939 RepID=A0ABZ3H7A9_9BACT